MLTTTHTSTNAVVRPAQAHLTRTHLNVPLNVLLNVPVKWRDGGLIPLL
jgi:hypothetical protein